VKLRGGSIISLEQSPGAKQARQAVEEAASLLEKSGADLATAQAELADEAAILRLLATLGLTAAEFSHETGMTFQAVRMDFDAVFRAAAEARAGDQHFAELVERARSMLQRLDALTAYINSLESARSAREMTPVSVTRAVHEFEKGMRQLAKRSEIEIQTSVPGLDPLFTRPMHQAEVASILLNFYSNAAKAMRRVSRERIIRVEAAAEEDAIVLSFSDTGDGIPSDLRDKVFDLFFTTTAAAPSSANQSEQVSGTGLGLWIVKQIVEKAGGEVEVVGPPPGFATRFEVRLPAEEE
jgi:signal transduction histidine kinase